MNYLQKLPGCLASTKLDMSFLKCNVEHVAPKFQKFVRVVCSPFSVFVAYQPTLY